MAKGEINRLQTEMGFGYIRENGVEEDIFFHSASLVEGVFDRLREGQPVEFERKAYGSGSGPSRALNVRVLTKQVLKRTPGLPPQVRRTAPAKKG